MFYQVYVDELCTADLGGTQTRRRQELCRSIQPETVHGADTTSAKFFNLGSMLLTTNCLTKVAEIFDVLLANSNQHCF